MVFIINSVPEYTKNFEAVKYYANSGVVVANDRDSKLDILIPFA